MKGLLSRRNDVFWVWLSVIAAVMLFAAAPATADVGNLEVKEYARDFDVSNVQAEATLEVQDQGAESGIVEALEQRLDARYAGVWFDNNTGEFVVPVLLNASQVSVNAEFADAELSSDFRTASAQFSWEELEAAHERLDKALLPLIEEGLIQTSLDPRTNAVVIEQAKGASQAAQAQIQGLATSPLVEVRQQSVEHFQNERASCSIEAKSCGYPLRGGVVLNSTPGEGGCTAGFKATGNANGNRFILTAGHCAKNWPTFYAYDANDPSPIGYTEKKIGTTQANSYPGGDWAAINANGSAWDGNPWPSEVAFWGVDNERTITSESSSYLGEYTCHVGSWTGSSCGYVNNLDLTVTFSDGTTTYHMTRFGSICSHGGDSGGPVFFDHTALGIFSGSSNTEGCTKNGYYNEITDITGQLGVTVGAGAGAKPYAETWDATNFFGDHVSGNGKVDPNGMPTTYRFEYGTTTAYGSATESYYAGAAMSPSVVSATISGLEPGTTYHYRISSSNGLGQSNGDDHTFKTNGYRYMLGTSSGGTTISSWNSIQGEMKRPTKMDVGDFTGDKKADIIAVESEGAGKYRYKLATSNGSGIASWTNLLTGMSEPKQMAVGDVTGDGKADVVSVESEGNGKYRYMLGIGTPPAYPAAVNADTPVSYWRLGETSGTTAADERATNPGTYQNSPTLGATSLLATDTANKAVSFDGTNDNVKVANSSSLQLTSPLSLEAWIKPTSLPASGSYSTIIAKPESYVLEFDGPRLVFTIFQGGVLKTVQAPVGALVAGQTYHVVGTYDGTTQRLYVNGTQVASVALSGAATTNTNPLYVCSWDGTSAFFKGTIDEPAVYKTALAGTRIGAHYEAGISTGAGISWNNFALTGMSLPTFMKLGDVNGDGKADVVSVESEGNGKYRYMLGISTGTSFSWGFTSLTQMSGPWSVSVGDVTGDKKADIVAVEDAGGGSFRYMIGTSTGTNFTWGYLLTGMAAPYWLALGDVNGDNKADVVANESEGGANYRYMFGLSTGSSIWPWGYALTGLRAQEAVAVGDVTGDGKADVVGVEAY